MTDIEIPLGKRTLKYRFFEMLPGLVTYSLVLAPIVLGLINPLYAAIFIIAFISWWLVRAISVVYRIIQGYRFMEDASRVDWRERLEDLNNPKVAIKKYDSHSDSHKWRQHRHYLTLQKAVQIPGDYLKPSTVYHAAIIPFMSEGKETLEPTIQAILGSDYNPDNIILILAPEERAKGAPELAQALVKKYKDRCFFMTSVSHPEDPSDLIIGKGNNIVWAAKYLQKYLNKKGIDPTNVVVTCFDSDNRPHPKYFALAAYEYCIDPKRNHRAYQPITLFLNNIWDAPAPMRVLATGNSFWSMVVSARSYLLRNFSAHSQGMASLIATDFWSKRTVVEDGHQYWRSYFAFNGDYEVTPIYLPISQDAVLNKTYLKTLRAQFIQLRRWAYGASDVAYVADKGFRKDRTVPFWGLVARFFRLLESHVNWAVAPIIILLGAWAPLVVNPDASRSIVAHELPQIASVLQQIAMVGLFVSVFLAFKMLPKRPKRYKQHRNVFMLLQWLLMPILSICYGSASALTAQTRLLTGRYLERFDVTEKTVKK